METDHQVTMLPKSLFVYVFMFVLILTDAFFTRFGRIRKRKNFVSKQNDTEQVGGGDLAMYFTPRTTAWPRLHVTIDPSVAAYYDRRYMKEYRIKQAYFRRAKKTKSRGSVSTAPPLFTATSFL